MANRHKNRKSSINENKLELAKNIAETSKSIRKTYASFENKFIKGYRTISGWIDFVLFNQRFSKLIALCLAIVLYLVINGGAKDTLFMSNIKQSAELPDVAVTTNISESVYEVEGLPENVDVMVRGDTSDVQFATQQKDNYKILADLSELPEGKHEVTLEPMNFSSKVDVTLNPSSAVVTIKKKISRSFKIGYDYINTDKLDKIYSLSKPTFMQEEVIVRASEETMNQVSFVKALIDLNGVKADFERDANLVAYDQEGNRMNVDILPEKVSVAVKVSSPSKVVPIVVVPEGTMPKNLAIDSYTLDTNEIRVYAPKDVLEDLDQIEVNVPVNKITKDTTVSMPIMLPNGVSKGDVTKVKISLKVKEAEKKEISNVPITIENINTKFNALLSEGNETANVVLKGTKSVLDTVNSEQIKVSVDLSEYDKAGTYEVKLKVNGSNKLVNYLLKNSNVKIILEAK